MRCSVYFVLCFLPLLLCSSLYATIIHVPADSTTIQGGINGAVDGDTVMVAPGTYHEYEINFLGKAIVVMGTDPLDPAVVAATIVDADSLGSVFVFHMGEDTTSVLAGLTITQGFGPYGGIFCDGNPTFPTITRNRIIGNGSTGYGGGIYCNGSDPVISYNLISGNWGGAGGGIGCESNASPTIVNNTIVDNTTSHTGFGGGIFCYNYSSPIISNNTISRNETDLGGGIALHYSWPIISNNEISNNIAPVAAGAIYSEQSFLNNTIVISGNVITENRTDASSGAIECNGAVDAFIDNNFILYNDGDGVWCRDRSSEPIIIKNNSIIGNGGHGIRGSWELPTISDNIIARNQGSGIYSVYSEAGLMSNNTVVDNYGDGIYFNNATATITNTILRGNAGAEMYVDGERYHYSTISISYSDLEGGLDSVFVVDGNTLNWGEGMIDEDPLFVVPGHLDYRLRSGSPCIDAGDPSSPNVPWGGWRRDMGVHEYDQGFYNSGRAIIWKPVMDIHRMTANP